MLKTGAILFDDTQVPSMGWACRYGESPFRIPGVHVLSSDTLWLTNIAWADMAAAGILDHAVFRADNFLRLPVMTILLELGFVEVEEERIAAPDQAVAALASIFERMIRLSAWINDIPRSQWRPPKSNLRVLFRQTLMPADGVADPLLLEAADEATQAFSRTRVRTLSFQGSRFELVVPRLAHARRILDTPVPADASYEVVAPPDASTPVSEWIKSAGGPMLIQAGVDGMPTMTSDLVNFGGITSVNTRRNEKDKLYQAASTRQWITSEEAMALSNMGSLTIEKAILFKRWTTILHAIPSVQRFFEIAEPLDHLSYSVGLVAENLWTGLTMKMDSHPANRGLSTNLIAPFLRSVDRLNCLEHVIDVANQEQDVLGFGVGRVSVSTRNASDSPTREAFAIAATAGMVPSFPMPSVGKVETPPIISDDPVYRTEIQLRASGLRDQFLEVDREVVAGFEGAKNMDAPVAD